MLENLYARLLEAAEVFESETADERTLGACRAEIARFRRLRERALLDFVRIELTGTAIKVAGNTLTLVTTTHGDIPVEDDYPFGQDIEGRRLTVFGTAHYLRGQGDRPQKLYASGYQVHPA